MDIEIVDALNDLEVDLEAKIRYGTLPVYEFGSASVFRVLTEYGLETQNLRDVYRFSSRIRKAFSYFLYSFFTPIPWSGGVIAVASIDPEFTSVLLFLLGMFFNLMMIGGMITCSETPKKEMYDFFYERGWIVKPRSSVYEYLKPKGELGKVCLQSVHHLKSVGGGLTERLELQLMRVIALDDVAEKKIEELKEMSLFSCDAERAILDINQARRSVLVSLDGLFELTERLLDSGWSSENLEWESKEIIAAFAMGSSDLNDMVSSLSMATFLGDVKSAGQA